MDDTKTQCIVCNAEILQTTSIRNSGRCEPCGGYKQKKKLKKLSNNSVNQPRNMWEFFLCLTAIVPIFIAIWLGGEIYSYFKIDQLDWGESWLATESKAVIRQVLWTPIAYALVKAYGYILEFTRLIKYGRAKHYPFGLRYDSNE